MKNDLYVGLNSNPDIPGENYITAGCGCCVYEGEHIYWWPVKKGMKSLCPDCFQRRLERMKLEEFADLLGVTYETV